MAITPATAFGTQMTKLTGNTGGGIQQLIESYLNGKESFFVETVTYAAQASGTVIGIARIPCPFVYLGHTLVTDTSTATATLAIGNAANGNSAIYKAAAVFTTTDTPTRVGKTSAVGVATLSGIDSQGLPTTFNSPQNGGGGYEDMILTTGVAALPGSGILRIITHYAAP